MPVNRANVEQQLAAIGETDRWWDQREVRELPAILHPDERIFTVVTGRLLRHFRPSRRWVLVVTDHRVICIKVGERFGRKQLDIPLAPVSSIAHRTGFLASKVVIVSGDRKHRFRVGKTDALKLIGALSTLIRHVDPLPPGAPPPRLPGAASREELAQAQQRIDLLEDEMERMRQQIDFVEDLLKRRETNLIGTGVLPEPAAPRTREGGTPTGAGRTR
jgi:hypothetical protein